MKFLNRIFVLGLLAVQCQSLACAQTNSTGSSEALSNSGRQEDRKDSKAATGDAPDADKSKSRGPGYVAPLETTWEFGLKISAQGQAALITGQVPIPMDWPEQKLTAEIENKGASVGKIKFSHPTKESKLMTFQVNRMNPGETMEVFIRFDITKKMIVAPEDTSQLRVPEKFSSELNSFLKPSPFIESKHKRIEEIARELKNDSLTDWEQVHAIYNWVRDRIEYKFDTQIRSCLEALDAGRGDCEEMSSLFIAICRSMKIPARAVLIPDHTYPEFYLEDENGKGYWFPCQVAGQYEFGSMTEIRPVLHKGDRFKIPGNSETVRYLQPTVVEKGGQGQISIQWITRQIKPAPVTK